MADTLPAITPSLVSSRSTKARVLRADFGDGYAQRAADGINSVAEEWSVIWTENPEADIDTLEDFLIAKAGHEAFLWESPRDSAAKLWTCAEWNRSFRGNSFDTLTATFRREFDLI